VERLARAQITPPLPTEAGEALHAEPPHESIQNSRATVHTGTAPLKTAAMQMQTSAIRARRGEWGVDSSDQRLRWEG
jgi:hypothetical protein